MILPVQFVQRIYSAGLAIALSLLSLSSGPAHADGSSIVTLGAGSGIGMHQEGGEGGSASAFVNQASVRLKLFYFLGLDYQYDLTHDITLSRPSEGLQMRAKMRLSALIYPYSGDTIAFYIGAGIGGTKLAELAQLDGAGTSYQGGIGFEIHIASHLSIDLSYMMVAPGVKSIERTTVAQVTAAYARGGVEALSKYDPPHVDDFLSLKNSEIMIRLLLFL